LEGFCNANWVSNNDEVSSTSVMFLPWGGAKLRKSTKQTCIAHSTMESEFIAFELAGQEAEWLQNLLYDIPLWRKPRNSAKQTCIAHSTMESEFIALELAGEEAEWLRNLLDDIPLWRKP
nr:zinc finger, CCHC-type [Tanacetum cinerariifolium]